MRWGKKFATGTLAVMMGAAGTGLIAAAPAQAAGKYSCKGYASMDKLGRPTAYSTCKAGGGKAVSKHRVKLTCDQVQGAREHVVTHTVYGPWVGPGQKSNVRCGFKNYLRGFGVQAK
ncbi:MULTISPECIES: hypothetical protein [unclassified Streptomyces]|uniref:hypothetical protein n=1 Tax=unclassified Streptomyces TaxID=2593676 RepID=UPI002DDC5BB7|nr:hypothetical protein [Streptomyces sp. NBC_01750]WSB02426.1 hypothetical protein OIE54_25975 [Streptomyces sp. NBC_01794]WSD33297.1 hypothetical protein OG966_16090 [Streptomyces sp. NBC_01750]